jgi:hypothetical protein
MLEALLQIICPECGHILKLHVDDHGCEYDPGFSA